MKKFTNLKKRAASVFSHKKDSSATVAPLLQLIQERKWRKVRKILDSSSGPDICAMCDDTKLFPLGAALGCNAPLSITAKILNFYPAAILKQDNYGSSPLHFGCLNGAKPDITELLLQHEHGAKAITMCDHKNYTPLHHIVLDTCSFILEETTHPPSNSSTIEGTLSTGHPSLPCAWLPCNDSIDSDFVTEALTVIRLLCDKAPHVVSYRTCDGQSPIDITHDSIINCRNEESLGLLQRIHQELIESLVRSYRFQKEKWEYEGYDVNYFPSGDTVSEPRPVSCSKSIAESALKSNITNSLTTVATTNKLDEKSVLTYTIGI